MSVVLLQEKGGEPIAVRVEHLPQEGPGRYAVTLRDRKVELEAVQSAPTCGHLSLPGRHLPFYVARRGDQVSVWIAGNAYSFTVVQRTAQRSGGAAAVSASDAVTAPMPGTILAIKLAAGDTFNANQPLIVMESMKMEMSLSVPHGGVIGQIHCRVGELVEQGARLATLCPAPAGAAPAADAAGESA